MSSDDEEIDIIKTINEIETLIVYDVVNYLKTGIFKNKHNDKYVKSYTLVYKASNSSNESDYGFSLNKYYKDTIENYCEFAKNKLMSIVPESDLSQNVLFFETFLVEFNKCLILVHWLQKIFNSLDKFYIPDNKLSFLFDQGMKLINKSLFSPLKKIIFKSICDLINYHRDGINIDLNLVMNVIELFTKIEMENVKIVKMNEFYDIQGGVTKKYVFSEWFENHFKISSNEYFSKKSEEFISRYSPYEYVQECIKLFNEENQRIKHFLDPSFSSKIYDMFNNNFIDNNSLALTEVRFFLRSIQKELGL